jgi:hypothetical protein
MFAIFRVWHDSLKMLLPSNLEPWKDYVLAQATETYTTLALRFWWLLIIIIVTLEYFGSPQNNLTALCLVIWLLLCFIAARPNEEAKDLFYFARFGNHSFVAVLLAIVLGLFFAVVSFLMAALLTKILLLLVGGGAGPTCPCCIFAPLLFMFALLQPLFLSYNVQFAGSLVCGFGWVIGYGIAMSFFSISVLFALFFLFDGPLSCHDILKAMRRGFRLAFRHYPLCLIVTLPFQALSMYAFFKMPDLLFFGFFLFPIYLAIFRYMYSKEVGEQLLIID